jgi:hypothetical protein
MGAAPELVLGLVALFAIAGITLLVLKLLPGKPPTGVANVCRNGTFHPLDADFNAAVRGVEALQKDIKGLLHMHNPEYRKMPAKSLPGSGVLFQTVDGAGQWGYCDCLDQKSKRLVGTGMDCGTNVDTKDCVFAMQSSMGDRVPKERAIAGEGGSLPVSATTDYVCGCVKGYGWGGLPVECVPVRSCSSTAATPLLEPCPFVAPSNDWEQHLRCCCKGCGEACYQKGVCACDQFLDCVRAGPKGIENLQVQREQGSVNVPVVKLNPRTLNKGSCGCGDGLVSFQELHLPEYIVRTSDDGNRGEGVTNLICEPSWEQAFGQEGSDCSVGLRWRTDGGTPGYDCLCNCEDGEGFNVEPTADTSKYRCCKGSWCMTDGHPACLDKDDYAKLSASELEAYCQTHCEIQDGPPTCTHESGRTTCCPQCPGMQPARYGKGWRNHCCNEHTPGNPCKGLPEP